MNRGNKGIRVIKWVVLGLVFITLLVLVTMTLWNHLVPVLFGGPVLSFWQTLGLLLLAKIFLFAGGGKRHHGGHPRWKQMMKERLSSMTPEEREAFRKKLRDRWCGPEPAKPGPGQVQ